MSSSSSSGGGRRSRRQLKQQPAGWWPSWLPPYIAPPVNPTPPATTGTSTSSQPTKTAPPPVSNPLLHKEKAIEHVERVRKSRESARNRQSNNELQTPPTGPPVVEPDIVREHDIGEYDPRKIVEILIHPGEEHTRIQEGTYAVMTGTRLDDETQEIAKELAHILQTIDPQALFENEPWYTTRLDPAQSSTVAPFPISYGNMTFPDLIGNVGADNRNSHSDEQTDARWYRGSETELDPYLRHALAQTYSGGAMGKWNEEWTQLEDLEAFLKDRLSPFFAKDFIDNKLQWDQLSGFSMIHLHRSLMEALWNEHWSVDRAHDPWVSSLNEEFADADELLSAVWAIPLVNEARLMEEFGYASIAEARDEFLAQVQYAYEKFDIQAPEDLHEWGALELANEFYSLLTNVFEPYAKESSESENYQKALNFIQDPDFVTIVGKATSTTIDRLDGSHQTSPMELVFFVASFFNEPLDWALTTRDIINALEDGDWKYAVLLGLVGLAPGALGRFVKRGKADEVLKANELLHADELLDEVADAPRVTSKVTASSGSKYIKQADGLFAIPGYPAKKDLREQLERLPAYDPSQDWRAPVLGTAQEAHHIIPKGMKHTEVARDILENKGISLHSYHNGVALEPHVHHLMAPSGQRGQNYADAVNEAMISLQHAPREEIEMFLEDLALRLSRLNAPGVDYATLFQTDIMDWLETFKQI